MEASGDWSAVEAAMRVTLPADYKDFIATYGSGTIGNFITIFNPFSERPTLNLLNQSVKQIDVLNELHENFGEPRPYDLYPVVPGLLPVGMTDNGDIVHWLTDRDSVNWTIVVNEARSPDYEHFNYNLSEFISSLLENSASVRAFPHSIFQNGVTFRSL
ncbi:MAG: SMI1/KNR4 family protein [Phenylobacterium sp.]|nr:MAG: SMI1/KNR4 family protein [Phenylobacterium sp.]